MANIRSYSELMQGHRQLIWNSYDEKVAPLLTQEGADTAFLDRGKVLFQAVIDLQEAQESEYEEKADASLAWQVGWDDEYAAFMELRRIMKSFVVGNELLYEKLQLKGTVSRSKMEFIQLAQRVYKAALRHVADLSGLGAARLNQEEFTERLGMIEALLDLRGTYENEKSDAVHATKERNRKYKELHQYSNQLKALALVALKDEPQLIERLGIGLRSRRQ